MKPLYTSIFEGGYFFIFFYLPYYENESQQWDKTVQYVSNAEAAKSFFQTTAQYFHVFVSYLSYWKYQIPLC